MRILYLVNIGMAYIATSLATIIAIDYPLLRFYNKWVVMIICCWIVVEVLYKKHQNYQLPIGAVAFISLYIFSALHDAIFPASIDLSIGNQVGKFYILFVIWSYFIKEYRHLVLSLSMACLAILLVFTMFYKSIYDAEMLVDLYARINPESTGMEINANTISWLAAVFLVLAIRIHEMLDGNSNKILHMIILFVCYAVSLFVSIINQTISASVIILFVIAWDLFVRLRIKTTMRLVAIMFLALFLFGDFYIEDFEIARGIFSRIDEGGSSDERLDSLGVAIQAIENNPFMGNSYDRLMSNGSINHTFYVNVLAVLGVYGFLLFIVFLYAILSAQVKNVTHGQLMARIVFIVYLSVAPPYPLLAILLIAMVHPPQKRINQKLSLLRPRGLPVSPYVSR